MQTIPPVEPSTGHGVPSPHAKPLGRLYRAARRGAGALWRPLRRHFMRAGNPAPAIPARPDLQGYAYVQQEVELHLPEYLGLSADQVHFVVIAGAYRGYELDRLLAQLPNASFLMFEPSPEPFQVLSQRFAGHPRVRCERMALDRVASTLSFHETNLPGCGSLLPPGKTGARDYGMRETASFEVAGVTLDGYLADAGLESRPIDLLWCDVQGAELRVLQGARLALQRCRSTFLEVAAYEPTYDGACTLDDLMPLLSGEGFKLVALGTDRNNQTGNALWLRLPRPPAGT